MSYYHNSHQQGYKPDVPSPAYQEVVPTPNQWSSNHTPMQQDGYESDDYGFDHYRQQPRQQQQQRQQQQPYQQPYQQPFQQQYHQQYHQPGEQQSEPKQYRNNAPWYDPRAWSRKRMIITVAAIVVLIIVIVVAAVAGSLAGKKNNSYPDYAPENYALKDTYSGPSFFDQFDYTTGYDPTHGFVHYVPQAQAEQLNLTYASESSAVLKVDTSVGPGSNPDASTGRFSVRVESKKTYNNGLFIFDVKHTPYGCGTWPALWLTDPSNWPDHGEIDIMESTNQGTAGNQMTLHTTGGCSMDVKRKQTFKALQKDCHNSTNGNAGCGVEGGSDTFGASFNGKSGDEEGGIVALEWRDAGIRMWQWARSKIPSDVTSKKPTPQTWGEAGADFPNTDCNIGSHFKNQSLVININLCGDLVEGQWKDSGCSGKCTDLVANEPDAFKDAYWEFGSFEVYQAS